MHVALLRGLGACALWLGLTAFQQPGEAWEIVSLSPNAVSAYDVAGLPIRPAILAGEDPRPFRVLIVKAPGQPGITYHHAISYQSVDCGAGLLKGYRDEFYDRSGKLIETRKSSSPAKPFNPEVVAGAVAQMVCEARHNRPATPRRFPSPQAVAAAYEAMRAKPAAAP